MSKKTFVIDTNVLLHDPEAIIKFPNSQVMIPVTVLEELDKMKRLPNDLGKNSRAVFRFLSSLHTLGTGDPSQRCSFGERVDGPDTTGNKNKLSSRICAILE